MTNGHAGKNIDEFHGADKMYGVGQRNMEECSRLTEKIGSLLNAILS